MRSLMLLSTLFVLLSCKKDQDVSITWGYECFPFDEGKYVIYDVMDIFHDVALLPQHDTNYYQIKEVIGESYLDGEGETYRKLRRYFRDNDSASWQLQDVWAIKRTDRNAEVVEENQRKVKMAFAISYDQFWDGNALNELPAEQYHYDNIYVPLSLNSLDFDSTVRVEHINFTSFISFERGYEIYSPGVGKIYSVRKDLEIDNYDTLDVQKGAELHMIVSGFGVE